MTFTQLRIVLVNPSHPGNIGAVARAMKTMCQFRLYLVNPKYFPCAEATARATGADDVLAKAVVCTSLTEAIKDCEQVVGTSARKRRIPWPTVSPRAYASDLAGRGQEYQTAILFGQENAGLSNKELEHCSQIIEIPANHRYSSLNIAAAVQILCYELLLASQETTAYQATEYKATALVTQEQMEQFYQHLERCMTDIGFFDPAKPRRLMRRMRRLFNRAQLDQNELSIMRGLLSAAQQQTPGPTLDATRDDR